MSLYIPVEIIILASGINEATVKKDIKDGILPSKNNEVWFRNAALYVYNKWHEGRVMMYPPYSEDVDNSFAMRVLSLMDDEIAAGNLTVKWKEKK